MAFENGSGWQGAFHRGHPDAVLLRYALDAVGDLSGLLISHLDVFDRGIKLRWCEKYIAASREIDRLPISDSQDLHHQSMLTDLLRQADPQYAPRPVVSAQDFLERIASVTGLPVALRSYGPTFGDLR